MLLVSSPLSFLWTRTYLGGKHKAPLKVPDMVVDNSADGQGVCNWTAHRTNNNLTALNRIQTKHWDWKSLRSIINGYPPPFRMNLGTFDWLVLAP